MPYETFDDIEKHAGQLVTVDFTPDESRLTNLIQYLIQQYPSELSPHPGAEALVSAYVSDYLDQDHWAKITELLELLQKLQRYNALREKILNAMIGFAKQNPADQDVNYTTLFYLMREYYVLSGRNDEGNLDEQLQFILDNLLAIYKTFVATPSQTVTKFFSNFQEPIEIFTQLLSKQHIAGLTELYQSTPNDNKKSLGEATPQLLAINEKLSNDQTVVSYGEEQIAPTAIVTQAILGFGSYGLVTKCTVNDETVALKLAWKPSRYPSIDREAMIMPQLQHENIVEFGKVVRIADAFYGFTMEYCAGKDLSQYLKGRSKLTFQQQSEIVYGLASALSYMHGEHFIHGDLSLRNVLVIDSGDGIKVKLTDFGSSFQWQPDTPIAYDMGTVDFVSKQLYEAYQTAKQSKSPPVKQSFEFFQRNDLTGLGVIIHMTAGGQRVYFSTASNITAFFNKRSRVISGGAKPGNTLATLAAQCHGSPRHEPIDAAGVVEALSPKQ